jgi:hypothetical protein
VFVPPKHFKVKYNVFEQGWSLIAWSFRVSSWPTSQTLDSAEKEISRTNAPAYLENRKKGLKYGDVEGKERMKNRIVCSSL